MAVKSRATLNSDADTDLADNTAGDISPADVRGLVKDLADSAVLPEDQMALHRNAVITSIAASRGIAERVPMVDGIVDGFGSDDGIDSGASSGYTHDPANGRVMNDVNAGVESMISAGAGSAITDHFSTRTSAAFDGTTTQAVGVTADGANGVGIGRIGKDYGGSPKIVTGLNIYGASDGGYLNSLSTCTIILKASNTDPTTTSWTGTTIGSITPFTNSNATNNKSTLGNANTTAYRYVWAEISGTNTRWVAEAQFYESTLPTYDDIVLVSEAHELVDFIPTTVKASGIIEAVDAATENTDVTIEVSRAAGEWEMATITLLHSIGTKTYFETDEVDVSGQTSADDIAYRYKTDNNKRVYLHGVKLEAAA